MALALIQMINTALSLWHDERKIHYIEQNAKLEEQYHEEINKPNSPDAQSFQNEPDKYRNNATVDNIEFQLRNLGLALSASIAGSDAGNKPASG